MESLKFCICGNCGKDFDILKRKPMALPCGHSFCFSCVNTTYKATSYLNCWTCHKKHFQELNNLNINHSLYLILLDNNSCNKFENGNNFLIKIIMI